MAVPDEPRPPIVELPIGHQRPGRPRLPPRSPAPAGGGPPSARLPSTDHRSPRAAGNGQRCYPRHGVSLSSRGSGRLVTRLDTPPSSDRRHPASRIAQRGRKQDTFPRSWETCPALSQAPNGRRRAPEGRTSKRAAPNCRGIRGASNLPSGHGVPRCQELAIQPTRERRAAKIRGRAWRLHSGRARGYAASPHRLSRST